MNKTELLALGLPEENLKEFREIYHRDVRKAAARLTDNPDRQAEELRAAILPLLSVISEIHSLRAILSTATHYYMREYRDMKEAAQGAANTQDGKAERDLTAPNSASSVNENKEESQA